MGGTLDGDSRQQARTFLRDVYATFFIPAFRGPPALWRLIRSYGAAVFRPAGIDPGNECGEGKRYLSDTRLAQALLSVAAATAIAGFITAEEGDVRTGVPLVDYLEHSTLSALQQAYLLWLFCSLLVTTVLMRRAWNFLAGAKVDFLSPRQVTTLFVYELAALFLPLLAILYSHNVVLFVSPAADEVAAREALEGDLFVYGILSTGHLVLFLVRLGWRAGLSWWRILLTAVAIPYVCVFLFIPAMFIALPFYVLPLLLLLYPVYALLRDYAPKPQIVRRGFDRVEAVLSAGPRDPD